jgi:parvulin-like peptidyl-prolyl isomerase|tara:strand:- start:391 stop:1320 length:930 start_codon:yes stop_codon:yes gene_type:complete
MRKNLINFSIVFFLVNLNTIALKSEINNTIVVKVGNALITSIDVQNEIMTNLFVNKILITQASIDKNKNYSIKNLINKKIKRIEVNKYNVKNYSKKDLNNYIEQTAKKFNVDKNGLKKIFKENNINYDLFVSRYETELLWNTLIYSIYRNQVNINIIDVENEIEKLKNNRDIEYNLSEVEILKTDYNEEKVKEILEVIKNNGFEVAVRKYSISKSANNKGVIGWVSAKSLTNKYIQLIKKLNIDEISAPIFNENSVTILKINEIKETNEITELEKLKEKITNEKKEAKLSLFSRSHFSNLENTISIDFK